MLAQLLFGKLCISVKSILITLIHKTGMTSIDDSRDAKLWRSGCWPR